MPHGPGKYDKALSSALLYAGAEQGALMVFDGVGGMGFSVQADLPTLQRLPEALRQMADRIEHDMGSVGRG